MVTEFVWCIMILSLNLVCFYFSVFYLLYQMYSGHTEKDINNQFMIMTIIGFLTLINNNKKL
jgi:hypothetical protein